MGPISSVRSARAGYPAGACVPTHNTNVPSEEEWGDADIAFYEIIRAGLEDFAKGEKQ